MSASTIKVGDRAIGVDHPAFLIAEVGTTCLGDLDKALALVEAGSRAGVDAVKFQLIDPEQIADDSMTYQFRSGGRAHTTNMKEMFRKLAFTEGQWSEIARACERAGVVFFVTVDYLAGVDMMERIGVPVHKIGAWDTTYLPLVKKIAATGKPTFVDLGPTSESELLALTAAFESAGGRELLFFHDFHTDVDTEMNLRAIEYLRERFPWPVGFSSPALDDDLDMVALGLGARFIEKRLILDRSVPAFHADESKEPGELADWVARIRHVDRALGSPRIVPSAKDLADAGLYYRSACTTRPVRAGESFSPDNLDGKRPGTGIPASRLEELWGRTAAHDVDSGVLIEEGHLG